MRDEAKEKGEKPPKKTSKIAFAKAQGTFVHEKEVERGNKQKEILEEKIHMILIKENSKLWSKLRNLPTVGTQRSCQTVTSSYEMILMNRVVYVRA